VDIPEELLDTARTASGCRTVRETVLAGLDELIRKCRREELRKTAGTLELDIDLSKSRKQPDR
jgi:hypothetical protein